MAEAPVAEPQIETAQPAPVLTSIDGLDAAMAHARATAEATSQTDAQPAPEPVTAAVDATSAQPADTALEGDDEGEPPPAPGEPARPSRMGRLREQLTAAEQRTRDAESRLQERLSQDAVVAEKYRGLLGTDGERAQLNATLANPNSSTYEVNQARTRLAQMAQAATELSPLRNEVERAVFDHFTRGMETLRTLDGMDEQSHQSLFRAPSGVEALRLMHGIGQKAAEENFKGEIASLKAQLADTKRQLAANGTQPAKAGGTVPGGTNALAGWLGPDGLPTEEAIQKARNGAFRDLASTT